MEKNENINLKKYMHPNVHSSIIYSCQDMEATYVSINRRIDKKDMIHTHNGILLSHKKNILKSFLMKWMNLESLYRMK